VQNFSKSLLDVADNLARASSVVKESFSKIDTSKDSAGAVPLLKTLLEGVDMTEKQLAEVLYLLWVFFIWKRVLSWRKVFSHFPL
jgi:molecular chaperone GrpE